MRQLNTSQIVGNLLGIYPTVTHRSSDRPKTKQKKPPADSDLTVEAVDNVDILVVIQGNNICVTV